MAKPLKKVSNAYWVYYVNEAEAKKFDNSKVGKWMYFFKGNDFAAKICEKEERGAGLNIEIHCKRTKYQ